MNNNEYPYLPKGRKIEYISPNNEFMLAAEYLRNNYSTDLNHPTGSVVVLNGQIVGRGANQSKIKNMKLAGLHKRGLCVRKLLKVPSGQKYWLCPGCATYKQHSEALAVADALSKTGKIVGADLYLYGHWWCCKPCWDSMIAAGIKDVFLVEEATNLFKK